MRPLKGPSQKTGKKGKALGTRWNLSSLVNRYNATQTLTQTEGMGFVRIVKPSGHLTIIPSACEAAIQHDRTLQLLRLPLQCSLLKKCKCKSKAACVRIGWHLRFHLRIGVLSHSQCLTMTTTQPGWSLTRTLFGSNDRQPRRR